MELFFFGPHSIHSHKYIHMVKTNNCLKYAGRLNYYFLIDLYLFHSFLFPPILCKWIYCFIWSQFLTNFFPLSSLIWFIIKWFAWISSVCLALRKLTPLNGSKPSKKNFLLVFYLNLRNYCIYAWFGLYILYICIFGYI